MKVRWKEKWKDNSGFTLMELLIVIAISAILLTIVTIAYSVVHNADVSRAARNFDAVLARARTESMAKGTDAGQLNLYMENGVLYYWLGVDPAGADNKEEICNAMIDVELHVKDGNVPLSLGDFPEGAVWTVRFATTGFLDTNQTNINGFRIASLWFSRGNRMVATNLYSTGKTDTELR